jgi:hypothetical protein
MRGNVAIQDNTVFIPMSDGDPWSRGRDGRNSHIRVEAIDLATLAVGPVIAGFEDGNNVHLSLAANTLIVASAPNRVGFYESTTLQETDSITIETEPYEFGFTRPVLMDGTTPIVFGNIGQIYLLNGPPLAATPEAAGSPTP